MDKIVIMHHGVKGMKWGVRRYQDTDGSLTLRGRNRLRMDDDDYTSISDDELRNKIQRLQMEKQYKTLKSDSTIIGKGKQLATKILSGVLIGVTTSQLTKLANTGIAEVTKKLMKQKYEPASFTLE